MERVPGASDAAGRDVGSLPETSPPSPRGLYIPGIPAKNQPAMPAPAKQHPAPDRRASLETPSGPPGPGYNGKSYKMGLYTYRGEEGRLGKWGLHISDLTWLTHEYLLVLRKEKSGSLSFIKRQGSQALLWKLRTKPARMELCRLRRQHPRKIS